MASLCKGWCGHEAPSESDAMCSGCTTLQKTFFGLEECQIPTEEQRIDASRVIDDSRGLSSEQMFLSVGDRFQEKSFPSAFRRTRRDASFFSEISQIWGDANKTISSSGKINPGIYPIPHFGETSDLMVSQNGTLYIDEMPLNGPLPLSDLSAWLSNPERVRSIRSWKVFLIAMSNCTIRANSFVSPDSWGGFLFQNSWDGIDVPDPRITTRMPGSKVHPFLMTIAMIEGLIHTGTDVGVHEIFQNNENPSHAHTVRNSPDAITRFGGEAASEWSEILERNCGDEYRRMHLSSVHPRLFVDEYSRLNMVVLISGAPTTVPVPTNAKIWKNLVHSTMFPEGSEGVNLVKHLFWVWESVDSEWLPSQPEINSSRLLRETIDSMNEGCSPIPSLRHQKPGICVVGESGIAYRVEAFALPGITMKFYVTAYPSKDHVPRPNFSGINICIDPHESGFHLPTGDICTSYILALRHDTSSRYRIHTLDLLLDACEWTNENTYWGNDLDEWWEYVDEAFTRMAEEDYHEHDEIEETLPEVDLEELESISDDERENGTPGGDTNPETPPTGVRWHWFSGLEGEP